jgi:hypothetical protein
MAFNPDSCPGTPGPDNFFNFMSYVDPECMFLLTPGQIEHLWEQVNTNRPRLAANSQGRTT